MVVRVGCGVNICIVQIYSLGCIFLRNRETIVYPKRLDVSYYYGLLQFWRSVCILYHWLEVMEKMFFRRVYLRLAFKVCDWFRYKLIATSSNVITQVQNAQAYSA